MNIVGPKTLTEQAYTLALHHADLIDGALLYWLVADSRTAHVAKSIIKSFLPAKSDLVVCAIDLGDERSTVELEQLLLKQSGIAIISIDDFSKLGVAISLHAAGRISMRVGQRLNPIQLKRSLVNAGYSEQAALFSVSAKGGALSIYLPNVTYRVLFSEEGIERIHDETTGSNRATVIFPPAHLDTTLMPEKEVPVPRGAILIDQADERRVKKSLPTTQFEWVTHRFLPFDAKTSEAKHFLYSTVAPVQKQFDALANLIRDWQKQDYAVSLFVLDPEILRTALSREGLQHDELDIRLQEVPMQGFIDTQGKHVMLSHADVFGRREVKKDARRDESAFLTSLQVNDYVVHEDHGVGRYLGLVSSSIEGHTRENLLIEYAKGDRLYVPVELAYKVDRYVGEAKPSLQRLSGTSWIRLTRKASFDSQEFAKELLSIYAKRTLVKIEPWHIFAKADQDMHASFGYQETPDQERAIQDVYQALGRHEPMDYLVVGDVGFGKTEVAIRAAYQAYLNKKQVVVLCPTTLLAQQHYDTFQERFKAFGVRVEMLSRFTGLVGDKTKRAADIIDAMSEGKVDIVIGTHRLLSKDIKFDQLGLIIIDEEQRFGVKHKERLKGLRSQAHVLTLSATPIPRTLYFSLSGLRDISTIQTPPQGRQAIETSIEPYRQERVKDVVEREVARGGQVFYLYNHVQTIHTTKRRLQELLGTGVSIEIVHGQLPEEEMARVAEQFDHGKIDVLVCTTIIESGLDLPNVNTLVVENSTRFGLGQLYQIRGRVGRGKAKAFAYFMYPTEGLTGIAARRLQVLQEAKDLGSGFQLAMRDLEMRGMGQLIGKRQHGHIQQVGLNLYGRLLRQAVEEIESGEVLPPRRSVSMSVPLDYGIPATLIPNAETRSRLYRQLSQTEDVRDVDALLAPYQAAIQALSLDEQAQVQNLQRVLELRGLAAQAKVIGVDYQESTTMDGRKRQDVSIEFEELRPEHVERLIPIFADFKVNGNSIVIKADQLDDFYKDMKRALEALQTV